MLSHKLPVRPWLSVTDDLFTMNKKHYIRIIHYYKKLQVIKQFDGFNADKLIKTCKMIFAAYRLPSRIISDAGVFMCQRARLFQVP